MKTFMAVCLILLSGGFAQTKPASSAAGTKSGNVLESKVRAVWEAFHKKDKATVSALLDEDYRTLSDGDSKFGDKKSEVEEVDSYSLEKYELTDFHVRQLGPGAALVTYTADFSGKDNGQAVHTRGVFGEVWVKHGNQWKCAYAQETALH